LTYISAIHLAYRWSIRLKPVTPFHHARVSIKKIKVSTKKNKIKYRNNEIIAITQKDRKNPTNIKNICRDVRMGESPTTTHTPGEIPAPLADLADLDPNSVRFQTLSAFLYYWADAVNSIDSRTLASLHGAQLTNSLAGLDALRSYAPSRQTPSPRKS